MHPYNLVQWNGKKAEGIVLPEVLLAGGGKPGQVLEALNILRSNSGLLEFVMVKGNVIVDLPGDALESLELQLFQLNSFHELQFRLPVIHFHTLVIFICLMLQSFRDEKTSGYINTSEANLLETTSSNFSKQKDWINQGPRRAKEGIWALRARRFERFCTDSGDSNIEVLNVFKLS